MRGRYEIIIGTNRVTYELCINRSLTVINGDSATGKTVLYDLVTAVANKRQGVSVRINPVDTSNIPNLNVLTDSNWKLIAENTTNTIFFIDEYARFIFSDEFSNLLKGNDNYYVMIIRHYSDLKGLPLSINEIYDVVSSGKHHILKSRYVNRYIKGKDLKVSDLPTYITEDKGSGRSFFKYATGSDKVIGAEGNGDVLNKLIGVLSLNNDSLVIIADAAAFGVYIEDLLQVLNRVNRNINLLLPESFEYLILSTSMFYGRNLYSTNPYIALDCKKYKSWERFYTETLELCAKQFGFSYSKRRGIPNKLKNDIVKTEVLCMLNLI